MSLEGNKILAAVLLGGIIVMTANYASKILIHPEGAGGAVSAAASCRCWGQGLPCCEQCFPAGSGHGGSPPQLRGQTGFRCGIEAGLQAPLTNSRRATVR